MTHLDTGVVSCSTCKFIRVEMQDQTPELLKFASLAVRKVCSAQSPAWLKARCFLPHVSSLEGLHDVVVLTSVLCRRVQLCDSASVQRDVAGSNCSSVNVGLLARHSAGQLSLCLPHPCCRASTAQVRQAKSSTQGTLAVKEGQLYFTAAFCDRLQACACPDLHGISKGSTEVGPI